MQMIPDPDVVRIRESYQIECECIWIRILESGFRNFYADPRFASGPYRTIRTPFSGSDWARTSLVCKGYPASRSSVRNRECYALQPDHAIQVRQTPNPQTSCLPLPSCSKHSPEPTRHGRASIPVRLAGLGFPLRMTRCRGWDFHADKPEFLDADKNLKSF